MSPKRDAIPDLPDLPKPGEPGFDYEAAYRDLRNTLDLLIEQSNQVHAYNQALLEAAVGYTNAPLRSFVQKVVAQRDTYRNQARRLQRNFDSLRWSLAARGEEVPADEDRDLVAELAMAQAKYLSMAQRNARKFHAIRAALDLLEQPEFDRAALVDLLSGSLTKRDVSKVREVAETSGE